MTPLRLPLWKWVIFSSAIVNNYNLWVVRSLFFAGRLDWTDRPKWKPSERSWGKVRHAVRSPVERGGDGFAAAAANAGAVKLGWFWWHMASIIINHTDGIMILYDYYRYRSEGIIILRAFIFLHDEFHLSLFFWYQQLWYFWINIDSDVKLPKPFSISSLDQDLNVKSSLEYYMARSAMQFVRQSGLDFMKSAIILCCTTISVIKLCVVYLILKLSITF